MDAALNEIVLSRLGPDPALDQVAKHLVMMAWEGDEHLASALSDATVPEASAPPPIVEAPPVRAYLSSVSVEGFRGIGPMSKLSLRPGPGLSLVIGRNGSGKSSFAE